MPVPNNGKRIFDHWDYVDPDDWADDISEMLAVDWSDLSEDEQWREVADLEEFAYEDVKQDLSEMIGDRKILCVGYADRWNGKVAGGYVADDLQDAIDELRGRDSGDIGWYEDEDGELHMTFTHHDGTSDVIMRAVTVDGSEALYDNEHDYDDPMSDREMHAELMEREGELTEKLTYFGR